MKYVITGASGNTGRPIVKDLLAAGHEVVAISRSKKNIADLLALGAVGAYGELQDETFLIEAFKGADAVYCLIPPPTELDVPWRVFQRRIISAMANALQINGTKYAVLLSSMGSQLPKGAGHVTGLHELEETMKMVDGLNVFSLRPAYFMINFFQMIPLIKNLHILGNCIPPDFRLPLIYTTDITDAATKKLLALDFEGYEECFLSGPREYSFSECAEAISNAIGLPDMKYIQFSSAEFRENLVNAGVIPAIADAYVEVFGSLKAGDYLNDYVRTEENTTPFTFEEFMNEFAYVYNNYGR